MKNILHDFSIRNLVVVLLLVIFYSVAAVAGGWQPIADQAAAFPMWFGVLWLGMGAFYLRKYRRQSARLGRPKIIWDEREEAVFYKALAWGFGSSWTALVLAVGWFIRRYQISGGRAITMVSLSVILGVCFAVLVVFFSLSVVLQKRGEEAADE